MSLRGCWRSRRPQPCRAIDPQTVLPLDPTIRTGTLPNGLKYFIRRNGRPEKRVSLRLAVKTGSLEEADDQQGLAHLIEHMAFNGSAHFKPGELVSYFERLGARLGPHVNAYTSFDETVYMLDLPTDQGDVVARGLTALSDFAGGLNLDAAEIEKERGVVIEEWRGGLGAGSRVRDKQIPIIFYNSRYADRLPIGKPEILRTAPPARLRAYYDTWYRPERQAVIAVGDIDPRAIEDAITSTFGPLRARAAAAPVPDGTVTLRHPLLVSVVTDPELTRSSVQVLRKRAKPGSQRAADYRRSLVERLVQMMLDDRFGELSRKPDAKFLGASSGTDSINPAVDAFVLVARAQDGKIDDAVAALAIETRRAREYGFNASELDRAKKSLAAAYEQIYTERDKSESGSFAQELLNLFLQNEPAPGIEYEYRLVKQMLPAITLDEVSAMARSLMSDDGRVVLVTSPQKDGLQPPTEAGLRAALGSADTVAVTPWSDTSTTRALVENKPAPATIVIAPRDTRSRRHHRPALERRRGLAEADDVQERPGALLAHLTRRRIARSARRLRRGGAGVQLRAQLRARGAEGPGPREDARGQAGERGAVHLAVEPRHLGERGAGGPGNRAPASLRGFRRPRRRPRAVRSAQAAADGGSREPRPGAGPGVRRAPRAGQHVRPLHGAGR